MPPEKQDNPKAMTKFAQLYTLFNQRREEKYFYSVLDEQVDIDYQVPSNDFLKSHKFNIVGCTALHFAVEMDKLEIVHRLLNQGADFTLKNHNGSTALHRAIEDGADERSGWKMNGKLDNSFVHPILSRHVFTKNTTNPSNKHGISHFHAACVTNHVEALQFFLNHGVEINHAVSVDSPIFAGYTGLHFAARCCALEVMRILLQRGADSTVQDARKMTAMHVIIERNVEIVEMIIAGRNEAYENIVDDYEKNAMMMNLLRDHDGSTVDSVGLTHFHIACTMKDLSLAQRTIHETNVDVNRPVNFDSPVWPGYTPLHFAAIFNIYTVKVLLTYGANVEAKDAKGSTPFDMCLERYSFEEISYILSSHEVWRNIVLSDNQTKLVDLVQAMENLAQFEALLSTINFVNTVNRVNIHVPYDSPLWPGNTLLHLAVIFYGMTKNLGRTDSTIDHLQLVDECLRLGAEMTTKNAASYTALHLAFRAGREDVVERMLQQHHSLNNPVDDDGLSHLHIACAANDKLSVANLLMSSECDINLALRSSFRWYGTLRNMFGLSRRCIVHLNAGSTPLHIAVAVGSVEIVELLIKHDADLYAKDADGLTPIHRVLTSCDRSNIGKTLLSQPIVREHITENGLSHLHITSFVNNVNLMMSLLDNGTDVNIAIAGESSKFSKNISIDMCDNPFVFVNSMSITHNIDEPGGQMSVTLDRDQHIDEAPVDPYGESAKYLDRYAGFTPLHFAMRGESRDAVHLLIDRGADILVRGNGLTPLYDTLNCVYNYLEVFAPIIKSNAALRERIQVDTGITMLHIACHKIDVDMVKDLLRKDDVDVNAVTNDDSPVWPSYTPLHVLMTRWERDLCNATNFPAGINDILQILLDCGADVARRNAELDTPLHIVDRLVHGCDDDPIDSPDRICVSMLLNKHTDFNVNPINSRGYSFFHMACRMNDVALVREYLNHGVDANLTISYFSDERAGESPLILTAGSLAKRVVGIERQLEVIDLLLEHGADVHAEDAFRNTPLHAAAGWGVSRESLLERLVSYGANIHAKNIFGDTPFERLLTSFRTTIAEVEVFLRHGFRINSFNEISKKGYMSMLFSRRLDNVVQMSIFEAMVNSTNVVQIDEKGRTALHNVVSNTTHPMISDDDFVDLIEKLTGFGIDIDAQDETGKTPLHTATKFRNYTAVSGLLKSGADFNILDANMTPAFAYFLEPSDLDEDDDESGTELTIKAFVLHLQKLHICRLEFSQLNGIICHRAIEKYELEFDFYDTFNGELAKTKNTKIGSRSFTLYDFLSETGAVAAYPTMSQQDRDAVSEFFESTCKFTLHREFKELVGLLKLQYRKALKRLQLVEPAKSALLGLVPCVLPDLCSEAILRFLSNSELAKLISIVLQMTRARKRIRIQ